MASRAQRFYRAIKIIMRNPFAQKANRLFLFIAAIGFLPISMLVFASYEAYPLTESAMRLAFRGGEGLCNCERAALSTIDPWYFAASGASAVALLISIGVFSYAALRLLKRTRAFIYFHTRQTIQSESGEEVVASDGLFAFCYGFIRPKICVSSGLLKRLSKDEASVVLRHEEYHQKTREPFKSFIVHLIASVYSFIPQFSRIAEAYETHAELAADFFATDGLRNKRPLAGALFAMLENDAPREMSARLLPSFAAVVEARVSMLIKGKYKHRPIFTLQTLPGFLLVPSLLILLYGVIFFSAPAKAHSSSPGMCRAIERADKYQCEMRGFFINNKAVRL